MAESDQQLTITFERIGRHYNVPPVHVSYPSTEENLMRALRRHARKYLASREFDIVVDLDQGVGVILVSGIRTVGKFTFEPSE